MKSKLAALLLLTVATALSVVLLAPAQARAFDPFGTVCQQSGNQSSVCNQNNKDPITGAEQEGLLIKAVHIIAFVTGVAAVIAIIIAGFEYVISAGDSTKIDRAKNALLAALIGLAVIIGAETVVRFIIGRF